MRKNSHFSGQPLYGQVINNPDFGDSYRKSATYGDAKGSKTPMELLRIGNNGQNRPYVLH